MLDSEGFDIWAGDYDASVKEADESNCYPFAGYRNVMTMIYQTIMHQAPAKVLDIGFGTGFLTSKLYGAGNEITGIDFSAEMIQIAAAKMPNANLVQWDFTLDIPLSLSEQTFDFIVSTYALHHLNDDQKLTFITQLLMLLDDHGAILIGDVGFVKRADLLACMEHDGWDEEEFYFVFSELEACLSAFCTLTFHQCSQKAIAAIKRVQIPLDICTLFILNCIALLRLECTHCV
ncbi:MAG: class I SAM-dependent methyltransferase [Clostridiales bacterium]|nr:class I SAM-dependent methyltransferase [Clostridiales bacterium]